MSGGVRCASCKESLNRVFEMSVAVTLVSLKQKRAIDSCVKHSQLVRYDCTILSQSTVWTTSHFAVFNI